MIFSWLVISDSEDDCGEQGMLCSRPVNVDQHEHHMRERERARERERERERGAEGREKTTRLEGRSGSLVESFLGGSPFTPF